MQIRFGYQQIPRPLLWITTHFEGNMTQDKYSCKQVKGILDSIIELPDKALDGIIDQASEGAFH